MKFLRKIGRKVKKGLGKLMSHKLGRIIGFIGLSMAMGAAAKALMAPVEGAVLAEAGLAEGIGAAATDVAVGGIGEGAVAAGLAEGAGASLLEGVSTPLIEEITISAAKRAGAGQISNTLSLIENASTSTEAFSYASNAMEANTVATIDGINYVNPDMATVHNNITSAVDHQFKTTFDPNATQRFTGYGPDTEFYMGSGMEGSAVTPPIDTIELYDPVQARIEAGIDQETLARKLSETGKFTGAVEGAGQGSLLDPVTVPLPQPDEVLPFGERAKDWLSETFIPDDPQEFIGDVGKGVVTGELLSVIGGEPEEQFYSKGISAKVQPIAPQAAYITAITPSYQAAMNTDAIPNFQQLKDANLVGTGSLQWMNMFGRQPLIFPNVLGLPQTSGGGSFRYG